MIVRGLPGASLAGLGRARIAPPKAEGPPLRWRDPRVAPFIVFGFVLASAQVMGGQILGFLVIDKLHIAPIRAQPFIAVAMMAGAVASLSAQWGVIRFFRMSPRLLLRWGAGLAALGSLLMGLAPSFAMVVAAFALTSLGFSLARPGFTAGSSLSVRGASRPGSRRRRDQFDHRRLQHLRADLRPGPLWPGARPALFSERGCAGGSGRLRMAPQCAAAGRRARLRSSGRRLPPPAGPPGAGSGSRRPAGPWIFCQAQQRRRGSSAPPGHQHVSRIIAQPEQRRLGADTVGDGERQLMRPGRNHA